MDVFHSTGYLGRLLFLRDVAVPNHQASLLGWFCPHVTPGPCLVGAGVLCSSISTQGVVPGCTAKAPQSRMGSRTCPDLLHPSCLLPPDVLHQISHREHGCNGAGLQDEAGGAAAALQGEAAGAGEAAEAQGLRVSGRLCTWSSLFQLGTYHCLSVQERKQPSISPCLLSSWYGSPELCTTHS